MTTKIRQFLEREIWEGSNLEDRTVRGKTLAALRILSIVWTGLENNRLASRSAALSYYSLIALGPLVAIMVMVSGFAVESGEGRIIYQVN